AGGAPRAGAEPRRCAAAPHAPRAAGGARPAGGGRAQRARAGRRERAAATRGGCAREGARVACAARLRGDRALFGGGARRGPARTVSASASKPPRPAAASRHAVAWQPASPASPARRLRACERVLELGQRPWLMGIVNASPESFSDGGRDLTLDGQTRLARELLAAGADILDIGGESARTDRDALAAEQEMERVLPLIERCAGELGAVVSVDTYKPAVAD